MNSLNTTLAVFIFASGLAVGAVIGWLAGRSEGLRVADQARATEHTELSD